jgi:hypothetical protein
MGKWFRLYGMPLGSHYALAHLLASSYVLLHFLLHLFGRPSQFYTTAWLILGAPLGHLTMYLLLLAEKRARVLESPWPLAEAVLFLCLCMLAVNSYLCGYTLAAVQGFLGRRLARWRANSDSSA